MSVNTANQTLSQKLELFFQLQNEIREACFRVLPLSSTKYVVVSFSIKTSSIEYAVLDSSNIPVLLHHKLEPEELSALANIVNAIEQWSRAPTDSFPIESDTVTLNAYRKAHGSSAQD